MIIINFITDYSSIIFPFIKFKSLMYCKNYKQIEGVKQTKITISKFYLFQKILKKLFLNV